MPAALFLLLFRSAACSEPEAGFVIQFLLKGVYGKETDL